MNLSQRDLKCIWHSYTQMLTTGPAIGILKGEGLYVFDENGNKYMDAGSSWWVNIHGHAHPYIAQKVFEQLITLEHVIFAGFTHEPAVLFAERLLKILPGNFTKLFYSDNGSTAVEVALKMAVQYWYNQGKIRKKVLVFEHSYHGDTVGAMSLSSRSAFTKAFESLLFEVICIPVPQKGTEADVVSFMNKIIREQGEEIAAFIFEPLILGAGGMLMYEAEAVDKLIRICKENNIVVIADEVMTGFGRTGKLFASEYLKEEVDIICLSKGITGGTMALGATACKERIYSAFLSEDKLKTFFHGHSYTANPVACAAANASLDLLLREESKNNLERICNKQLVFAEKLKTFQTLGNIRCCGTILAFDVKTSEKDSYFNSRRDELYTYFLDHGIILRPLGNTLYILPPYIISDAELDYIYSIIEEKFRE